MSSRRNSITDALDSSPGQTAFSDPVPAPGPAEAPRRRTRGKGPEWEANNTRQACYCPNEVWAAIGVEMAKGERSKTGIIVDAVREHLGLPDP